MGRLTRPVQPRRQHRHRARLQHLLVQVFLLQPRQVLLQLAFVDGLAGLGPVGDGIADFFGQRALFAESFPVLAVSRFAPGGRKFTTAEVWMEGRGYGGSAYMMSSTLSMVSEPWMSFMALLAFFMARRVSWLILADSME